MPAQERGGTGTPAPSTRPSRRCASGSCDRRRELLYGFVVRPAEIDFPRVGGEHRDRGVMTGRSVRRGGLRRFDGRALRPAGLLCAASVESERRRREDAPSGRSEGFGASPRSVSGCCVETRNVFGFFLGNVHGSANRRTSTTVEKTLMNRYIFRRLSVRGNPGGVHMSRRRVAKTERKTPNVSLLLNEMERDALDAGAERFGVELQTYLRTLILAAYSGELPSIRRCSRPRASGPRERAAVGNRPEPHSPARSKRRYGLSPWSPTPARVTRTSDYRKPRSAAGRPAASARPGRT
jgi:hypothetical protein